MISLYRPRLVDRVAAGGVLPHHSGRAAKSSLLGGLTQYQIHAVPDGILTADIAGLVRDPSVDARDHLRCHAYGNALFQSQSSLLPNCILATPAHETSLTPKRQRWQNKRAQNTRPVSALHFERNNTLRRRTKPGSLGTPLTIQQQKRPQGTRLQRSTWGH